MMLGFMCEDQPKFDPVRKREETHDAFALLLQLGVAHDLSPQDKHLLLPGV